jgi:hypothetical protein
MPRTMRRSKWPWQPTTTRNRPSSENWSSDWRACYGGCVARPPSCLRCSVWIGESHGKS